MRQAAHSSGVRIGIGMGGLHEGVCSLRRGPAPVSTACRVLLLPEIPQHVLCVIAGKNLDQRLDELPLIASQSLDFLLQCLNAVVLFTCLPGHRYAPESWVSSWSS